MACLDHFLDGILLRYLVIGTLLGRAEGGKYGLTAASKCNSDALLEVECTVHVGRYDCRV